MSFVLQNAVYVIQASVLVGCSESCGHFVKDVWGAKLGGAVSLQLMVTHKKVFVCSCVSQERDKFPYFIAWAITVYGACHSSLPLPDRIWGPLDFRHVSKIAKNDN